MPFFGLFSSSKWKRPSICLKPANKCFEIGLNELISVTIIEDEQMFRLQFHSNYEKPCFELIYKRWCGSSVQLYSVMRCLTRKPLDIIVRRMQRMLTPLTKEVDLCCFSGEPEQLGQIFYLIQDNKHWTAAHLAAQVKLAGAFSPSNKEVILFLSKRIL